MDKSTAVGSTTVSTSSGTRQSILDYAAQFLGTPYVYGGSSPDGFDCSGFTSYVYKNTASSIARTSSDQRATTKNISRDELLPGDLVFFGSGNSVSHVGIYTGNGQFIHSRTPVRLSSTTAWIPALTAAGLSAAAASSKIDSYIRI